MRCGLAFDFRVNCDARFNNENDTSNNDTLLPSRRSKIEVERGAVLSLSRESKRNDEWIGIRYLLLLKYNNLVA